MSPRGKRKRKATKGQRIALGVFVAGLLFGALMGEYNTIDWFTIKAQIRDVQREVDRLEIEVDSLAAYADSIENDRYVQERVARERFSMIRDGEIVYFLEPEPPRR